MGSLESERGFLEQAWRFVFETRTHDSLVHPAEGVHRIGCTYVTRLAKVRAARPASAEASRVPSGWRQLTPDECQLHYGVGAGRVAGTGAGGVIGCISTVGFAFGSTETGGGRRVVAETSQKRTSTAATAGTRTQSAPTVSVADEGSCGPGNRLCGSSRYGGRGSWVTAIGHLLSCPRNRHPIRKVPKQR